MEQITSCPVQGCQHPISQNRFCSGCGFPLPGATLNKRYELQAFLDSGGFAVVYSAYDLCTSQERVVKVLHDIKHDKAVELFKREAELLRKGISGLPRYFDDFEHGQYPCIVMERIKGQTLWKGAPLKEETLVPLMVQLADILDALHKGDVIHRDIKPQNIMFDASRGVIKLIDLGGARPIDTAYFVQMAQGQGGTKVYTKGFAPPEQMLGQAVPQSDLYAVGVTMIVLLTGREPTDSELFDSQTAKFKWKDKIPSGNTVSDVLSDIIDKLTEPQASNRIPSAGQLKSDLEDMGRLKTARHQNPPHTYTIPISVQVDDNRTVVKKKRSGIAWWLLVIVLGFGISWLLLAPPDRQTLFGVTTTSGPTTTHRLITFPNGDRYEGQLRGGKQHGNGTMTWANGDRYEGQWQNGRRHGIGKLQLADGGRYEGQWANDKRSGQGTFTWPDGGRYEGQWQNGKRHGSGTFTWPNGRRHEGQWRDDKAL